MTVPAADGSTSSRTYDASGFPKTSLDFRHFQTNYTYDSHGWLTQVKNPLGFATSNGYDSLGRQLNVTTPLGFRTQFVYDSLDRRTKVTDPLGNSTSYVYDARGDLTKVIDPNGYATQVQINVTLASRSKTIEAGGNFTSFRYHTPWELGTRTNSRTLPHTEPYESVSRRTDQADP